MVKYYDFEKVQTSIEMCVFFVKLMSYTVLLIYGSLLFV